MNWKSSFGQGKELVLATCSSIGNPHANIVISLGFTSKNQLLVANCQMKKTMKNLQSNKNICLIGGYFRLFGKVKIYKTGKYFELCVKKNKQYEVSHAIVVTVKSAYDLDKGKIINL